MLGYMASLLRTDTLNLDSNVLSLVPQTEADPAVERAFSSFSEQSMKELVFVLVSNDKATAIAASDELAITLQQNPRVASVQANQTGDGQQAIGNFYFENRYH